MLESGVVEKLLSKNENNIYKKMIPEINNKGSDRLSLTLSFPELGYEDSSNSDSALIRPYLRLLEYGNPTGKINYLFYKSDERTYVLGSLCLSPERHLLFFPGIIGTRVILEASDKGKTEKIKNIDHFTLNNNFNDWHITIGSKHSSTLPIKKIKDNLYYWFSLSIISEEIKNYLEILPADLKVEFEAPSTDAKRRMNDIIEARRKAVFHIVQLPNSHDGNSFITFEFYIDRRFLSKIFNVFPSSIPYHGLNDEKLNKIMTRIHPARLQFFGGVVWVRVSAHKGNLQHPCIVSFTKN